MAQTTEAEAEKPAEESQPSSVSADKPKLNRMAIAIISAIAIGVAVAVAGVFAFVESERQRDVQAWQVRLGIIADSRTAAVNEWVELNFNHMRELAQNASLQLYLSDIASAKEEAAAAPAPATASAPEPAFGLSDLSGGLEGLADLSAMEVPADLQGQESAGDAAASATYLRNLLNATAERIGFKAPPPVGEIAANVERVGIAGIGLLDKNGTAIVSTPDMPPVSGRVRQAVAKALDGEPAIIDLYLGASGEPTMGFVLPIYGIQDDSEGAEGIGAVVGLRVVGRDLYDRLKQPGDTTKTSETYLVRANGATVEYLTPLADGTPALKRSMSSDTPDLAGGQALARPGGFAIGVDYAGAEVLAASRPIASVPWVLIRKISRAESLAATDSRLAVILGVFISIIIIVTLSVLYVWKKGASVRATQALHDAEIALERFGNISKFMRVVTDNQPNHIVAVDGDTHYTFSNLTAARDAGLEPADMMGKTMASVIGPIKA
ncbi:MAG: cache domain-containing protein [Rhodospirillales bacterium]|nr:cache domain-containing protein [Rhodospirillales bacterium]